MLRSTLLATGLLATLPISMPAFAEKPPTANRYSYLEVSAQIISFNDPIDLPSSRGYEEYKATPGLGFAASAQVLKYAFGFVDASAYRNSGEETELKGDQFNLGGGLAYPVVNQLDVLATLAYTNLTATACTSHFCADVDGDGYTLSGGVRFRFNDKFNLLAKAQSQTITTTLPDGVDNKDTYNALVLELVGGQNGHGIVAGFTVDEDEQTYKLGYRYTFE